MVEMFSVAALSTRRCLRIKGTTLLYHWAAAPETASCVLSLRGIWGWDVWHWDVWRRGGRRDPFFDPLAYPLENDVEAGDDEDAYEARGKHAAKHGCTH